MAELKQENLSKNDFLSSDINSWLMQNEVTNNLTLSLIHNMRGDGVNLFLHCSAFSIGPTRICVFLIVKQDRMVAIRLSVDRVEIDRKIFPFLESIAESVSSKVAELSSKDSLEPLGSFSVNHIQLAEMILFKSNNIPAFSKELILHEKLNDYELDPKDLSKDSAVIPPGFSTRFATENDFEAIRRFYIDFTEELTMIALSGNDLDIFIHRLIREKRRYFLTNRDGEIVAQAGFRVVASDSKSIGAVYTPEAHRRNGYATVVVARLCSELFESGTRRLMLFADAANPTSNAIYQRIGFRAVGTSAVMQLRE